MEYIKKNWKRICVAMLSLGTIVTSIYLTSCWVGFAIGLMCDEVKKGWETIFTAAVGILVSFLTGLGGTYLAASIAKWVDKKFPEVAVK